MFEHANGVMGKPNIEGHYNTMAKNKRKNNDLQNRKQKTKD
jgi:hypothetical protein